MGNGNPCVVGGLTQGDQHRDTVFCLVDEHWETWPSLNIARSEFAMIEIDGMPCAAGGQGTASYTRNHVECWDGTEWNSDLISRMRARRYRHTSIYIKGYPCLVGGKGTNSNNNVECFVDGRWTLDEVPSIPGSTIENARAAIINGHSCILGGQRRHHVVCFNEDSNSWDNDLVPDFSQDKYGHAITTFEDGTVCTIAGREENHREWKSECFDGSTWVPMDPRVRFFPDNIHFHEAFVKQFPTPVEEIVAEANPVHPVGELCIIGGRFEEGAVRCFDGTSWSIVEEASFPEPMFQAATAYLNGKPCVTGGKMSVPNQSLDTTFCYVDGSWEQWPSLNHARHLHQIIEIDGFPCAVGGGAVPSTRLSSVECWDGNEWREDLIPDLTEPRHGHTAMFIKGYPCMALGAWAVDSIECYVDGEWTQDEVAWDTNLQQMIAQPNYGVLNGYDCIIGGFNSRANAVLKEVYCFNEESNSWETDLVPNMNGRRTDFATITLPDGAVCAMPSKRSFDTIECFDGTSWNTNDPIPSPGVPDLRMYSALVLDIPNLSGGPFESNSADEERRALTSPYSCCESIENVDGFCGLTMEYDPTKSNVRCNGSTCDITDRGRCCSSNDNGVRGRLLHLQ